MNCPSCGRPQQAGAEVCSSCGASLKGESARIPGQLGQVVSSGQTMTVKDLAGRLGVSSSTITVNDGVGIVGGALLFVSYFLTSVSSGGQSASLVSYGGFWGAVVPIVAALMAIALVIPKLRPWHGLFAGLAAFATGIAVGTRTIVPDAGYAVGWWMALIGGILLVYSWAMHGRVAAGHR